MVNVVACCDAFKGTLSANDAGRAISRAISRCEPGAATVRNIPVTDGGSGFLSSMVAALNLKVVTIEVTGPLGKPVKAAYGLSEGAEFAVVEMAAAAGLPLIGEKDKNPLLTTTFGVGEIIRSIAANPAVRDIYLGIGGSATNDGGLPALQALGLQFKVDGKWIDENSAPLRGGDLTSVEDIKYTDKFQNCLHGKHLILACDVTNPLIGKDGATRIYGPQKGANTPEMLETLEKGIEKCAGITEQLHKKLHGEELDLKHMHGAGGAGGMSGFFRALLHAEWKSGAKLVAELIGLESHIAWCDFVVTGEGSYDDQTIEFGKTLSVVESLCQKYEKRMIVVCGQFRRKPPVGNVINTANLEKLANGEKPVKNQPASEGSNSSDNTDAKMILSLTPRFPVKVAMSRPAKCIEEVIVSHYEDIKSPTVRRRGHNTFPAPLRSML